MIRYSVYILVFLTGLVGLLWGASAALSRASERTVVYQFIADALDAQAERKSEVLWSEPSANLARPFTESDEELIGLAMTQAWAALALAQGKGESAILQDGFSGVALERAIRSVEDAQHGGRMVVLEQRARPEFFHLDGSVFQAEVSMLAARYVIDETGLGFFELSEDRAMSTLMNESNGWRVFAHERLDATRMSQDLAGWSGGKLAGINYYPASTPWREFWSAFDRDLIQRDFERMAAMGANAVRVFLTHGAFADPETQNGAIADLRALLEIAEATGVQLVPTLFDLKATFTSTDWSEDHAVLKSVLPVLADSSSVVLVDLKNEPDLDFEAHGKGHILAWLSTLVTLSRDISPDLPLTIGWSSAEAALELEPLLDVVSYHDYAEIDGIAERFEAVSNATDRPVIITEIGVSSYEIAMGIPGSPEKQARLLEQRLEGLAGADGVFVWTLYDFAKVDASAVGASPWVQKLQSRFGLLEPDGTEKAAVPVVKRAFERITGR